VAGVFAGVACAVERTARTKRRSSFTGEKLPAFTRLG
jgi:hypothetical protein